MVRLLAGSHTEVNAKDNHVVTSVHLAAAFGGSVIGSFADATGVVRRFVASPNKVKQQDYGRVVGNPYLIVTSELLVILPKSLTSVTRDCISRNPM